MKQLLFLLLFPCLAMAQYQGNANQKITLGEQTTADGLVWRGRLADTANLLTNKLDTSVYIVLDTGTRAMWYYSASTTPKWTRLVDSLNNLQGQLSLTTKVTGTLPLGNGGTGSTTQNFVDLTTTQSIGGAKTFTSAVTATRFNPTANTAMGTGMFLPSANSLGFSTDGVKNMSISNIGHIGITTDPDAIDVLTVLMKDNTNSTGFSIKARNNGGTASQPAFSFKNADGNNIGQINGDQGTGYIAFNTTSSNTEVFRGTFNQELWVGYTSDNGTYKLQVNGQIFATNATIATSDEKFKENITPLNKGLEIVNKLKPVTFNFIIDTENNFSEYEEVGFIAQDVDRALSTETFAKSIVKSADDSEPTSTMGLATQNLIPILVKAVQEQQALIKALEQRILTLENK